LLRHLKYSRAEEILSVEYEYFLGKFAMAEGQRGGVLLRSIVKLIGSHRALS
jgi:hypothetical protein